MPRIRDELRALSRLTGPLLLTQLGQMLLGVVDTAVVGRLGEVPLAAVGLAGTVFFTITVLGFGWMLALDPLIAQAVGAGERTRARELLWQGGWVAAVGTVPLTGLVLAFGESLGLMGNPPAAVAEAQPYLYARLVGLLPFLALAAGRAFLQAHELTRPLVVSVIVANVLNLPLTWWLVHGDGGLEALGLAPVGFAGLGTAGAGWASTVATLVQLGVVLFAVRALWPRDVPRVHRPERAAVLRVLRLGTPIGLQLAAEVGSFAIATVLIGNLGTRPLSAHNVAITWISVTFQVAIAVGSATAVRVGHAIGRADAPGTRRAGLTGIASGAVAMIGGALVFLWVPSGLARVLTDEPGVIEATVPLLAVAAAFQLSDGVQAVAAGALRGAGDTRWPLVANLVGHYAIGVPLGASLAFVAGWGATGVWWGLSAGLTAVAVALTVRFGWLSRRPIARA
ncbi:MAG TPA: MATE family efflux transporter [Sandaracinaceae bacterium LLY-WYZ-13_1]|nr:MATE family efflux transporter [Sandaracinaceae bacterium LLY-WYZ-13_1]